MSDAAAAKSPPRAKPAAGPMLPTASGEPGAGESNPTSTLSWPPRAAWHPGGRGRSSRRSGRAWRRGERIPAERYLARYPRVCSDLDAAIDLIFNEFLLLEDQGQASDLDEFVNRFPEHASVLHRQFELHLALKTSDGLDRPAPTPTENSFDRIGLSEAWTTRDPQASDRPSTNSGTLPERFGLYKIRHCWVAEGWEPFTWLTTTGSIAMWRSRCRGSTAIRDASSVFGAKPASPPTSLTRTFARCSMSVAWMEFII